jgi:hypothetical protein
MKTNGIGPHAYRDKSISRETNCEKWRAVARRKCVSADSAFDALLPSSLSLSLSRFLSCLALFPPFLFPLRKLVDVNEVDTAES